MKKMNKTVRNFLYGFLAWLIPFVSAFFFYSKEGGLVLDIFLFTIILNDILLRIIDSRIPHRLLVRKYDCVRNL